MARKTTNIVVRIEPELKELLEYISFSVRDPLSSVVRNAILEYVSDTLSREEILIKKLSTHLRKFVERHGLQKRSVGIYEGDRIGDIVQRLENLEKEVQK